MATTETWQGQNGEWYSKDEYGNVFDQNGDFLGNDPPPRQQQQPRSGGTGGFDLWGNPINNGQRTDQFGQVIPGSTGGMGNPITGAPPYGAPAGYRWVNQNGQWVIQPDQPLNVAPQGQLQYELNLRQLEAQTQYNQQYLAYLQQQAQQNAGNQAAQLAIDRERLRIEQENARLNAELQRQRLELERQRDEFQRGQAIQETLANPRSLVQSLLLLGASPAQAAGYLQTLPLVQGMGAAAGTGQQAGWAPPAGGVTPDAIRAQFGGLPSWEQLVQSASSAQGGSIDPTTGRNPLFPFIEGRKLPVRQTLSDIETNNPRVGTLGSLFSFSGQDPNAAFGEFQSYLPKGGPVGLTSFR